MQSIYLTFADVSVADSKRNKAANVKTNERRRIVVDQLKTNQSNKKQKIKILV